MPTGVYERKKWPPKMRSPLLDRFWAKVDKSGGPDACWPWLGHLHFGYGSIHEGPGGRIVRASRLSWEIANGRTMHRDRQACHRCNNRACVNPAHIYEGTPRENSADTIAAGHSRKGQPGQRGEINPHAKLTEAAVRAIRARYTGKRGDLASLGREFHVTVQTIHKVIHGRTWAHVV